MKIINETVKKQNIHLFIILACISMQMFTFGEAYRFFAYLNVIVVAVGLYQLVEDGMLTKNLSWLKTVIIFPIFFVLLHFIAQQNVIVLKEMRHLLIAVSLVLGIAMLSDKSRAYLKSNLYNIVALIIFIYALVQTVTIIFYGMPYGTTKNPHYLAFYSSISLIVCLYCFFKGTLFYRYFFSICMFMLGFLLLETGSRPAWLGLLFSLFSILLFLHSKQKLQAVIAVTAVVLILSITNAGSFLDRSKNLIMNLSREERVTIWTDTWTMQKDSSIGEWLVGHGIDSFEEDFKLYSTYHKKQMDFNSPHNYFLEILYISGFLGLISFLVMFGVIYQKIISKILLNDLYKSQYIMLFAILTTSVIFAGITLPFFNAKSMNLIACLLGVILYIDRVQQLKSNHE